MLGGGQKQVGWSPSLLLSYYGSLAMFLVLRHTDPQWAGSHGSLRPFPAANSVSNPTLSMASLSAREPSLARGPSHSNFLVTLVHL